MFESNAGINPFANLVADESESILSFLPAAGNLSAKPAAWRPGEPEGELAVDVLETEDRLIIIATMAGTRPEDIELHLQNDCLTIRGRRLSPAPMGANYFNQECYWGKFSRTIVLPSDTRGDLAESEYKSGVLIVRLPKGKLSSSIPIMVIDE